MTNNLGSPGRITQPTFTAAHLIAPPAPCEREFTMQFSSTPRGARLARRLAAVRLDEWDVPYGTAPHEAIVLIVGELTANAVRHGHVPGRDFHLRLLATTAPSSVAPTARVEVSDTRAERLPPWPSTLTAPGLSDGGRGLLLVSRLAARWGWHPRSHGPGKTVWAEYGPAGSPPPGLPA
ncbi:ATP-binding protein [Streptomyces sp. NPDC047718]|uniref:ATP-binding protein n=1 Tax=Streptomyces sp. NPDC047718 TaxID=3155479 RepID=UPI0033D0263F